MNAFTVSIVFIILFYIYISFAVWFYHWLCHAIFDLDGAQGFHSKRRILQQRHMHPFQQIFLQFAAAFWPITIFFIIIIVSKY